MVPASPTATPWSLPVSLARTDKADSIMGALTGGSSLRSSDAACCMGLCAVEPASGAPGRSRTTPSALASSWQNWRARRLPNNPLECWEMALARGPLPNSARLLRLALVPLSTLFQVAPSALNNSVPLSPAAQMPSALPVTVLSVAVVVLLRGGDQLSPQSGELRMVPFSPTAQPCEPANQTDFSSGACPSAARASTGSHCLP